MQVKKFESGGFVVHKLSIPESKMTFSAWYDEEGQMLDLEAFMSNGKQNHTYTAERAKGEIGVKLKLVGFQVAASLYPLTES